MQKQVFLFFPIYNLNTHAHILEEEGVGGGGGGGVGGLTEGRTVTLCLKKKML